MGLEAIIRAGSKLKFDTTGGDKLISPNFTIGAPVLVSVVMKGNGFSDGKMEFFDQNGTFATLLLAL